jgi:hypothetical protein
MTCPALRTSSIGERMMMVFGWGLGGPMLGLLHVISEQLSSCSLRGDEDAFAACSFTSRLRCFFFATLSIICAASP